MQMTRLMLKEKDLPNIFWAEIVYTDVYLLNKCLTKFLESKTPFSSLEWKKIISKKSKNF